MSWSYTFFAPTHLPLTPAALSEETVHAFTDAAMVQAALSAHLPRLAWAPDPEDVLARGTVTEGDALYEFSVMSYAPPATPGAPSGSAEAPELIVSLRSSGRVDSASFVQRLCEATGWIAFDDRVYLFQPHHLPVPAGRG